MLQCSIPRLVLDLQVRFALACDLVKSCTYIRFIAMLSDGCDPAELNPTLLHILRCPVCKGSLSNQIGKLFCVKCQRAYAIIYGIPDLRVYEDPLIPLKDELRKADRIQTQAERLSFAELVRYYWSLPTFPPPPPHLRERFIHHVLTDERRVKAYVDKIGHGNNFLEVGCGT